MDKPKNNRPSIILTTDLLHAMALTYCEKLPHFKGKHITSRMEFDYNDTMTGNIVVEVFHEEEA